MCTVISDRKIFVSRLMKAQIHFPLHTKKKQANKKYRWCQLNTQDLEWSVHIHLNFSPLGIANELISWKILRENWKFSLPTKPSLFFEPKLTNLWFFAVFVCRPCTSLKKSCQSGKTFILKSTAQSHDNAHNFRLWFILELNSIWWTKLSVLHSEALNHWSRHNNIKTDANTRALKNIPI